MDSTQLLKGVLDVAVLAVLRTEDGYGYDIVRRLRDAGLGDVGDASVYGTLRRLYAAGSLSSYVVPSDGGPHRKYYAINPQGRTALDAQTTTWLDFAGASVEIQPAEHRFTVELQVPGPTVNDAELRTLAGRFLVADGLVLSAIVLARAPAAG